MDRRGFDMAETIQHTISTVYEQESRRVLATLIRLLGDFDAADEALQDAFRWAVDKLPWDGVPATPRACLVSAGRFKAIDGIRRQSRFSPLDELADAPEIGVLDHNAWADEESVEDDRLRLIFT